MDLQTHWEEAHRAHRPQGVSWYQTVPTASLALVAAAGAPKSARLIDVGGGISPLADHLLDAGYTNLTVLDLSAVALAHSQERLGSRARQVTWMVANVLEAVFEQPFDVWHERAVFHFLTEPEARAQHVAKVSSALKPGGFAIVATFAEDGPPQCSGLPVVRYSSDGLAAEFGNQFEPIASRREVHVTPGGKEQPFVWVLLQKR